ncbi:hypothetical protein KL919_003316 [Ogataea angusta]|nr:hypothetical protein KL909_005104 [Ogataea angusta]KAG7833814.1 hypothetical protein KL943_003922 [Ogataea angusta]KAG7854131.1 hypothetical protein KL939_005106 [Ogataea angusta]KAG7858058.1 hypothetical protein KL919_003316 [Ogataea angusta]
MCTPGYQTSQRLCSASAIVDSQDGQTNADAGLHLQKVSREVVPYNIQTSLHLRNCSGAVSGLQKQTFNCRSSKGESVTVTPDDLAFEDIPEKLRDLIGHHAKDAPQKPEPDTPLLKE